jgi:hypothetical protein
MVGTLLCYFDKDIINVACCTSLLGLLEQNSADWMAWATDFYFLPVQEAECLRFKCQQGWFLLRTLFLASRLLPSVSSYALCSEHNGEIAISGVSSSSPKDISPIGLGSLGSYLTSFTSLEALAPDVDTFNIWAWGTYFSLYLVITNM